MTEGVRGATGKPPKKTNEDENMKIAGIIAEYDPFHVGHAFHLRRTKELGADAVCVVMSGDCVQRGMPAFFSKFDRAEAAVENGADLVLELPVQYAAAGTPVFAGYGVRLLAELGEGVINSISFGSETGDIRALEAAAEAIESVSDSEEVRELMQQGLSFGKAVTRAAGQAGEVLLNPNDLLATEYIRAAKKYMPWAAFTAVERMGAHHNSEEENKESISASKIRAGFPDPSVTRYIPERFHTMTPVDYKKYDVHAYFSLVMHLSPEFFQRSILDLPDGSEALLGRLISVFESGRYSGAEDFAKAMSSKNMTYAKVRRIMLGNVLGLRKSDIGEIPFGRILALNETGVKILAEVKKKKGLYCRTSLSDLRKCSPFAKRSAELMLTASRLREICTYGKVISNELTRKIMVMK